MSEHLLVEREQGVLTLRMHRPDKKNALTRAMYSGMAEVLAQADQDKSVRAVLITGGESCFTSGNDVADFIKAPPSGLNSEVFQFMQALFEFSKPVVAAVNGPEYGSSLILPRLLGHARTAELLLLGESFTGEQAAAWGIANQALTDGAEILAKAREMALRFQQLAPAAVADSKRLMRAPDREQLRRVIEEEGALFGQRLRSPEAIEALTAFMQRRTPDFSTFA